MKSLLYVCFTSIKNSIKDLKHNPGKLIYTIFMLAFFAFMIIASTKSPTKEARDITELHVIILALYSFSFVGILMSGLSSGASFYSMADVNIIFPSPISSKIILLYGLLKQMGTSLLMGFFLLFQYAWLNSAYNLSFKGLIAILIGFCISVICGQITAMVIYCFSSNNDKNRILIKAILLSIGAIVGAYLVIPVLSSNGNKLSTLLTQANSSFLELIPIIGWLKVFVVGLLSNNYLISLYGLLPIILYIILFIFIITKINSDFYEDVLKATEVSFSAITAQKEGKAVDVSPAKVKLGKIGINKGNGASVFYYKHMLENRRAKSFILDMPSIIFIIISIIFAVSLKNEGLLPVFIFSTYMQIFSSCMGRWLKELTMPYVYMVPVNPFKKLIMIFGENIYKTCVEALVLYIPIALIIRPSILEVTACILARIGFGLLFMGANILTERFIGSVPNKGLIIFLYFIIIALICLPGVVIGVLLGSFLGISNPIAFALFSTFLWNVLASALITFLCRNILSYAELNNK